MTRSFLKSLAIVVTVPLLVSAIALFARDQFDGNWANAVRRNAAMHGFRLSARDLAGRSLAIICSDPRAAQSFPACAVYNRFSHISLACAATAGFGVALLAGLVLMGHLSGGSRRRLAGLFRPTLYGALTGVALLVVAHGLLAAIGLILIGQMLGSADQALGWLVALGSVAVAVQTIRFGRQIESPVRLTIVGLQIDPERHPRLRDMVRDVAGRVSARPPDQIVAGLVPDICVTGAEVDCLDGIFSGHTLFLSLPLCRILSIDELRGLLTHELARAAGDGYGLSGRFYPRYTGAVRRLAAYQRHGFLARAVLAPARHVTGLLLEAVGEAEGPLARTRELEADRAAAEAVGVETYASALIKVHAFDPAWDLADEAMNRAVVSGIAWENVSALFAEIAVDNAGPDRLKGLSERVRAHPTEPHLSLARRLGALSVDPARVSAAALDVTVSPNSLTLFEEPEALETGLSGAMQTIKGRYRAMLMGE